MTDIQNIYAKNRIAYIIEAAVEYFISLLITDTFITNLLTQNGVSDAATGIIIQLASFAFTAQLFSLFYNRKGKMKVMVTSLHLINQLVFALLYMIPNFGLPKEIKVALLVIMFLGGHFISNIVSPYKISWLMSYVDDDSRGKFTANKEIISLMGGMLFTLIMGNRVDHYMELQKYDVAFSLCGITILALAIVHFVCLLSVKEIEESNEKKQQNDNRISFMISLKEMFGNRGFLKVMLAIIMWYCVTGVSVSFFGSYKLNTLGFNLSESAILAGGAAVIRAIFSRKMGKFADKNSWAKMLHLCFVIAAVAFAANIFVIGRCPKVMFIVYSLIYGIAMAGINSGIMNILFDYVPHDLRSAALGISNSICGIVSFFAALVGGAVLEKVQSGSSGKMLCVDLFGLNIKMYGQQVLSLLSFVICVALIVYVKKAIVDCSEKK